MGKLFVILIVILSAAKDLARRAAIRSSRLTARFFAPQTSLRMTNKLRMTKVGTK